MRKRLAFSLVATAAALILPVCILAGRPACAAEGASPWQFSLTPYMWAISLNGDAVARGIQASVDSSFIETVQEADSLLAFAGRFEARYGAVGAYIDGTYAKIGVNDDVSTAVGVADLDVTTEMVWLEFAAFYRIGRWPLEISPDATRTGTPALAIEPYAGVRYTSLGLDIDIGPAISAEQARDWVDPIVGTRVIVDLSPRWQLLMSGDVGGFGVGSDFSWNLLGLVDYRFHLFGLDSSLLGGYRALSQDFDAGSGANRFEWDVITHGPVLGLTMRF